MDKFKNPLAGIVTIVVLVAFAIFAIYLLRNIDMAETEWTRSVYLLSGVEAILFAAVGWLFGKEVHREQAKKAEERAENAEQKQQQSASKATKGEALAQMVLALKESGQAPGSRYPSLSGEQKAAVSELNLSALENLARQIVS